MKKQRFLYLLAAAAALIAVLVFLPALRNDFLIWDDDEDIVANVHIRSLGLPLVRWAMRDLSLAQYWQPVTWMSHAVDYALWGLDPRGHHLTNVLLHGINTLLVVLLAFRLIEAAMRVRRQDAPPDDRFLLIAAGVVGLLFGTHPLRVEAVAWVAERKELLFAGFSLAAVLAYIGGARQEGAGQPIGMLSFVKDRRYLLALLFFALALASKPMAVTLPLVLMILDWYPLRRIGSLREAMASAAGKWPFFAGSVAVGLVTVMAQREAGSLPNFHSVPVLSRALVASWSLVMYLVKTVVPLDLSPLYPYPTDISIAMPRYAGSVIAVVAVTAAAAVAARRQRSWLALWSCFLVMLLPVLGLFQVGYHSMADRFTYLPGLALFLPAGIGAATAWERTRGRAQRGVMAAGAAAVLVLLCILTVRQTAVWKDSITLWSTVIDRYPDRVPLAYINRGAAFAEDHDADRALRDFDTAIRLAPDSAMAYMNRGRALQDRGRTDAAIADYTKAIGLMPSYALAYTNRGSAYQRTGRTSEALEDFSRAVRLSADDAAAYLNRGILYGELGRFALALEDLSAALRANPFSVDAYTARGLVLERSGEPVKALADLDAALALDPANANARLDRGVVLERLGRLDEAAEDYGRAAAADPTDAQAFAGLGRIRKAQGRCDEAVADLSRALSLRTDVSGALLDRAGCYRALGQALLAAQDYRMACERGEEAGCAALMSGPGRGGAR